MTVEEKLFACFDSIKNKLEIKPLIGLVLGSGLGDYADKIKVVNKIDYHDIDNFPVSTVSGHKGCFVFGYVEDVPVVIMQGRVHYYEGYSMQDVVLPIRLMKLMGIEVLFLTNAAGGVNESFNAGDLMLITDQIGSFVPSSLIGANIDRLGERFPDMTNIYDKDLQDIIIETAKNNNIILQKGTYIQFTGPNYESPMEVKMSRLLGADAVGMSTACEAIAANHMKLKICGISCISNPAAGISDKPLTHIEVKEAADKASERFTKLVTESVININEKMRS